MRIKSDKSISNIQDTLVFFVAIFFILGFLSSRIEFIGFLLFSFSLGYFFLFFIMPKDYSLELYEIILLSVGFSIVFLTLIPFYASYLLELKYTKFLVFLIVICQYIAYKISNSRSFTVKLNKDQSTYLLILCFLLAFFLIFEKVYKHDLFMALDPYLNKPIVEEILSGNFRSKEINDGFFYFLCVLKTFGFSIDTITKYGGAIFLAISSCYFFLFLEKFFKMKYSLFSTFLFLTTPIVFLRFQMTLRENFSIMLLFFFMFFIAKTSLNNRERKRLISIFLILLTIAISHSLTAIFAVLFLVLFTKFYSNDLKGILFLILIVGILTFPLTINYIHTATKYIEGHPDVMRENNLKYFNICSICLSTFGIINIRYSGRKKFLFLMLILLTITFLMGILLFYMGIRFHRCIIYASIPLSILSSEGIFFLKRLKILNRRVFGHTLIFLIIIVTFSYSIEKTWCPLWNQGDLNTIKLLEELKEEDPGKIFILKSQDEVILRYSGFKKKEIFCIDTEVVDFLSKIENKNIYIYASNFSIQNISPEIIEYLNSNCKLVYTGRGCIWKRKK